GIRDYKVTGVQTCALPILSLGQQSLARHVIDLQPDAVGILEQHRVIAGRPLILARRADDFGADRGEEAVQFVDIGALAGAEAERSEERRVGKEWRARRSAG